MSGTDEWFALEAKRRAAALSGELKSRPRLNFASATDAELLDILDEPEAWSQASIDEVREELDKRCNEKPSFWGYFTICLGTKYGDFAGRAQRVEYWSLNILILVFLYLASLSAAYADEKLGWNPNVTLVPIVFLVLYFFAPALAVAVRRMHDIGLSGWLAAPLLLLQWKAPNVAEIIYVVLGLIPPEPGTNQYGPSPRYIAKRLRRRDPPQVQPKEQETPSYERRLRTLRARRLATRRKRL